MLKKFFSAIGLLFSDPQRFFYRVKREFVAPSIFITRCLRRIYCSFFHERLISSNRNDNRLLFVYDTLLNPVTFDFLHYLYYAECMRREKGRTHVDLLLISRPNLAISREASYIAAVGEDDISWRLMNLIVPLTRLFPAVGRIYVLDEEGASEVVKAYQNVYPEGYSNANPKAAIMRLDSQSLIYYPVLKICDTAQKIIGAYIDPADKRRVVTITLRTYDYISCRNSDIDSWIDFANELDPRKYRVIFVPDASIHGVATMEKINKFEIFNSACWNIELRAALYHRAWMNMGVVSGPLVISALIEKVWTVMIDRTMDYPEPYRAHILSNGNIPGKAPGFYSKSCKFYLGKDDKETIIKLFNEYTK